MKRIYRSIGSITLSWLIGSCGGGGDSIVGPPPPTTASVTISSDTATLVPAATIQFSATARTASGAALSRTFSWTSSDLTKATVSSSGMVVGVAPGTATITAAVDGKSAAATITVLDGGVVSGAGGTLNLESGAVQVVVPPAALTSTINLSVAASSTLANDPRVVKGTPFDFGPSGTIFAKPVVLKIAYLPANLPAGTAEGALEIYFHDPSAGWQVVPGSTVDLNAKVVSAEVSHFSTYAILIPEAVATVAVTPPSANVVVGATQQLTALLKDANGNVLTGRAVTWNSSNTAAATVDASGLVTGVAAGGPVTITATSETKTGTSAVTVSPVPVATLTLSAPTTPMTVGGTQVLTATPKDGSSNTLAGRTVNWVSSNPSVLSVSAPSSVSSSSGATITVTAAAVGTAIITATSESAPSTSTPVITVDAIPVATVSVSPPSAGLVLGITPTQQLTATLKDANSNVLTGRAVTWTSSVPSVATVDANGFVTAVAAGSTAITATSETKTGTSSITVSLAPVATVAVTPPTASVVVGGTQQLAAQLKDSNGNVLTGRAVTWSSSNNGLATVDATGLVTGVAAGGPVTITATSETKTGTSAITVSLAPVATVTVTPPTASIVVGATQQLTAVAKDANGNVLTGRTVTWSSNNTAVATVNGTGLVTGVAAGAPVTITATSETKTGTSAITVTLVPVATVTVTPSSASLVLGIAPTQQLTAVTKDGSGNVLTGRTVTWSSNNNAVATVDANGLVTAQGAGGPVTITATSETKTGISSITVSVAPVATVTVTPASPSVVVGGTQQLTAVTKDANGNVLTGRTVTWSSGNTALATVSTTGLVTAVAAGGPVTITATSETKTGTSSITVTLAPVNTVTVTPPSASLVLGITPTQQLTAVTKDANGNVLTGRTVTWSSNNNAVATVDANGLVTAQGAGGPVAITATSETKTGTSSITVSLAPVATVTVTPPTASVVVGGTQQLSAQLKDSNGNMLTGRTVTWSSSNNALATVDATGLVTGIAAGGPVTITATSETKTGTSSITVTVAPVATLTVTPPAASVVVGGTQQLSAQLKDSNGNMLTGRTVTWSSSNNALATVDATGLVSGIAAGGPVTITATSETKTGTSSITVTVAPVATVTVTPPTASVVVGGTQQLSAQLKDSNGNMLTGRTVTWSSSNNALATVDATGLVTGVASGGPVTITATSETKTGTSSITVTLAPVATVTVTPTSASLVLGITTTQQLTAVTKDANGNVLTGRTVTWSSSNNAVATVDATGLVTAVGAGGPVTITATSETKTGTSSITVTLAPVATVTVTPPTASIVVGATQQLTAVTKDANGNVLAGRTVTWSSNNTAVATVDGNGLVTGVAAGGPATITATSETKTGTSSITVHLMAVATVTLSAPTTPMIVGGTQVLTATPKDPSNNTLSGRTVNWVSSNTAVLTVSASSSVSTSTGATMTVTAVGQGTATITATSETAPSATTPVITVNPVPVATVTVTPSSASLVLGIAPTQQLTAVTKDGNGNVLTGRTVTWSSNNNAVATVDANGLVTAQGAGGPVTITATSETKTGTSSITVSVAPVASVTVTPSSASVVLGITPTQQLTAVTKDANGTVLTGRTVTWSSSNNAVATVDANGLVTAVAAGGPAIITATSETKTGTSSITVTLAPANTVTVTPASASLVLGITPTQQLTAVTKDANGNVLTGRTVTWSSGNTAVATVSSTGLVTAVSAGGPVTITATSETKTGTSSITVALAPVNTVTVTPATASVAAGGTQQLAAQLKDSNGNVLTGRTVTWSSSNNALATVDATGLVTGIAVGGPVTITATSETKTGTSAITVTLAPVATVTVTPPTASVVVGGTQQLVAQLKDSNGNVLTGRTVTWSSSNNALATVDATGLVTGIAVGGPVTITATSETKTGTSSITVTLAPVATVTVTPTSASLVLGITPTQQLTAVTKDSNGNVLTGRTVTWSSNNNAVATVDGTGLVTAVAAGGPVTIMATSETKTGTSSITVALAPVNTVTVTPPTATVFVGATQQLAAQLKDSNGNVLTGRSITWSSSNGAVATVSSNGLVTGVTAGGPVTITATSETKTGTSSITVNPVPVATVTLSAPTTPMILGGTQVLTAVTKDSDGNVLTGRTVSWVSSNTAVLSVSPASSTNGTTTVTAAGLGTATITATSETAPSATTPVITVNPVPVSSVTVTPTSASLVLGITPTQQLTAVTKDSNGNVLTGRTVTWSSNNNAVATVDANGLVTAQGAGGPVTITATSEMKTGTSAITVTQAPVATVEVTPTSAGLVLGITPTQQLTAVTKDANGTVLTGRTVTWSSNNNAVATVDVNGLVTAQSAGGPVTITATSETKTGTSSITVTLAPVDTVTVTPASATLVLGITPTQQLTAVTKDANGNVLTGRTMTWSSSNTAIATVDASGLVTAVVAGGPVTITATSETKTGTSSITVTVAPVNSVTVTPVSASVVVGGTQQLTAVTKDANGTVLTGRAVTWSSSNNAIASVDGNGLVTGLAAGGPVTITATSETKTGTSAITVTLAPVATVTVSAPTTPMVVGGTQLLTATLMDGNNNTLTGRTVSWVSSNTAVLTVNPASSTSGTTTVTGVGVGTATITATSESVNSAPTPVITVTLAPVNSVTVSPSSASLSVGVKQQLTATLRDANNIVLTGRVVTWTSSNPAVAPVDGNGLVTGLSVGGPVTITATSETKTGTSSISVTQAVINGPLQVSTVNPRYFADASGRVVYLTGSHYWKNVQDDGTTNPPSAFDNVAYLDFLQQHNHNFTRLWLWEQARWSAETDLSHWFAPTIYVRVGTDTALDGQPKFDLSQINPAYLSRLRQRVIDAKARGIYVSVMLFDGWSIGRKGNFSPGNPWLAHPFNAANNINGIDGDPNADTSGVETQTLAIPAITALQETYVKAVIDAVNDLDNVIYEISNESDPSGDAWQYHMINLVHSYEATKPKQHPVGMTVPYPNATNSEVLSSPAEWVSMNAGSGDIDNLELADGTKVSLSDTDHLCGICGDAWWPWRSLMRGHNTLLMDGYDGSAGVGDPAYDPNATIWEIIRNFMGYARSYSLRMDLAHAAPHPELSDSHDCLAVVGNEYLVLLPAGGSVTVDLSGLSGTRSVEWFQPRTNTTVAGGTVTGGGQVTLTAPGSFIAGSIAVLYIHP